MNSSKYDFLLGTALWLIMGKVSKYIYFFILTLLIFFSIAHTLPNIFTEQEKKTTKKYNSINQ